MGLEVRQMIVKTSVVHRTTLNERPEQAPGQTLGTAEMRKVLAACRRVVLEMLRERRER
jgi:hypothetical protein